MIPYKQTLSHGCLVACLLMLHQEKYGIDISPAHEEEILMRGARRTYPFYVVGVPQETYNKFHKRFTVYADNKYFANVLKKEFSGIDVRAERITIELVERLTVESPVACHIDDHYLGDYSHCSHFIVVERIAKRCCITDPWSGKRKWIAKETLEKAISGLKNEVKMCPLLFQL